MLSKINYLVIFFSDIPTNHEEWATFVVLSESTGVIVISPRTIQRLEQFRVLFRPKGILQLVHVESVGRFC